MRHVECYLRRHLGEEEGLLGGPALVAAAVLAMIPLTDVVIGAILFVPLSDEQRAIGELTLTATLASLGLHGLDVVNRVIELLQALAGLHAIAVDHQGATQDVGMGVAVSGNEEHVNLQRGGLWVNKQCA